MFPVHQHCFRAAKLLLGALIFLHACSCALSSIGETCYSRQHRDTIVNVRKALDHQKTIMDVRKKEAEKDCILACCSEELKPGIKCNMVMYKPLDQDGIENCYLFHCETEQDCPMMSAKPGTNTYDIFKGMTHPSAKVKERVPTMPVTITKQPSTTHSISTTVKPTTTTTTTQPTTTTSSTQSSTTTPPTTTTTSTIAPTDLSIILLTMPSEVVPATTTTTTTQSTTTTTKVPSTTSTTTTTHLVEPPQLPPARSSKKQTRPPKKPEPHGKSNTKVGDIPTPQKQATQKTIVPITTTTTSTTTSKPTTSTTTTTTTTTPTTTTPATTTTTTTLSTSTTTTPSTTTTTTPSTTTTTTTTTTTPSTTTTTSTTTTERTTIVIVDMDNDLKNRDSGPAGASASDKAKESHLMWKNGLAFLVVLTLIILTFVVAVVGRRAMESFDRRHYTRLELNDLHYEI